MSHGKKWSSSLWHTIFFKACIEKRTFVLTGIQGISKCTHYKYTFVCLINQANENEGRVIVQGLSCSNDPKVDYIKKIFIVAIRDTVPPFPETTWKSGKLFRIFLAV